MTTTSGDWIVVEIGCLECGIGSYLVGRFENETDARAFRDKHEANVGSDIAYEVFNLNTITEAGT